MKKKNKIIKLLHIDKYADHISVIKDSNGQIALPTLVYKPNKKLRTTLEGKSKFELGEYTVYVVSKMPQGAYYKTNIEIINYDYLLKSEWYVKDTSLLLRMMNNWLRQGG